MKIMDFFLDNILIPLLALIFGALGGWFTWVFLPKSRKLKEKTDDKTATIDKLIVTIDQILDKYNETQKILLERNETLLRKRMEISELEVKVANLEKAVKRLEGELAKFRKTKQYTENGNKKA